MSMTYRKSMGSLLAALVCGSSFSAVAGTNLVATVILTDGKTIMLRNPQSAYVGADGDGITSPRWESGPKEDSAQKFSVVWDSYDADENGKPKKNKIGAVETVTVAKQSLVFPFTNVVSITRIPVDGMLNTRWQWVNAMEIVLRDGTTTVVTNIGNRDLTLYELRSISPAGEAKNRKIGVYHLWNSQFTGYLGGSGNPVQGATTWRGLRGTLINPDGSIAETNKSVGDFQILKIEFNDRTSKPTVP